MSLEQDRPVAFSKPIRQIIFMIGFLTLVGVASYLLYRPIETVFFANPWLNGGIGLVFIVGVLLTFAQVFQLYGSVNWLEAFAIDRPGHEFIKPPTLLASLSALLRDPRARSSLTAISTRSILDTVATRLDETRDVTRYIVNLLIFLGLLGTFWGLANTIPAVVDTIRNLAPQEGEEGAVVFDRLLDGLDDQLAGMGTAFASSLLGLAGSLVVGLLELFAGHAQNRFYRELEEWLSSITRIISSGDGEGVGGAYLSALMEKNAQQMTEVGEMLRGLAEREGGESTETLKDALSGVAKTQTAMLSHLEATRDGESAAIERIADSHERILGALQKDRADAESRERQALERIAAGQERMLAAMERDRVAGTGGGGLDEETRQRIRSLDLQLLRIVEELTAGRQESVADLRAELRNLAKAISSTANRPL